MSSRRTSLNIFQSDRQRQGTATPPHGYAGNLKSTASVGTPGSARYGLYKNADRDSSPEGDPFRRSASHRGSMQPLPSWSPQKSNSAYADQDIPAVWRAHAFRSGWLLLATICIMFGGWGLLGRVEFSTIYRSVARYVFLLGILAVTVAVLTCVFIALWVKRENDALLENRLQLLHHDVLRRLQAGGTLVIIHTRDELCAADGVLIWSRLEKRVSEDSRVRTQRELVQGEEQRVWKWLGRANAATGDKDQFIHSIGGGASHVLSPFGPTPAPINTRSTPQAMSLYPTVD